MAKKPSRLFSRLDIGLLLTAFLFGNAGCSLLSDFGSGLGLETSKNDPKRPYVLLVMLDGYRADYTARFQPPTLLEIRRKGVSAEGLIPVYPSDHFPAQYSIATGLYPENHGILGSVFYDPDRKRKFNKSKPEDVRDGSWYSGIPFWAAAEKQGVTSAVLFWPGSEAIIAGVRPSYFYYYDDSLANQARVDQIITWLKLPSERRPHLLSLYFSFIDKAGHKYGTQSPKTRDAVLEADRLVARLIRGVTELNLPVNFVFLSSQGMEDLSEKRVEYLDDYVNIKDSNFIGEPSKWAIYDDDPQEVEKLYLELKKQPHHFKVYRREEVPSRLHYSKNKRAGNIVLAAEAPYVVRVSRALHRTAKTIVYDVAGHGYDPFTTLSMHGIFYALGPAFQEGMKISSFESIHLYPFLMKLMGLKVLGPIDGDEQVLSPILK